MVCTTSSVRLHICAVTSMTEISLHVTLNTNKAKQKYRGIFKTQKEEVVIKYFVLRMQVNHG